MANDCGSTCPVDNGFLSYKPNLPANVVLLVLFTILIPGVAFLGYRHQTPAFSATLVLALVLNSICFVGRILLHVSARDEGYFFIFFFGSILGPTMAAGAIFFVLPHVLTVYGEQFSPCRPTTVSFILHGVLGAAALVEIAGAVFFTYSYANVDRSQSVRIIAAGLALQIIALVGSAVLYGLFTRNLQSNRSSLDLKHFTTYGNKSFTRFRHSLEASALLLFIYSVYRVAEMADGIRGTLFQSETAFMIADSALPLLSCILLAFFPPGVVFGSAWNATSLRQGKRKAPPPPLRHAQGYDAHHRYDPDIRKQFSLESQKSPKSARSNPPEVPEGSPGLPASPRPAHKLHSPTMIPSPRSVMTGSTQRNSNPIENRRQSAFDMVDSDAIW